MNAWLLPSSCSPGNSPRSSGNVLFTGKRGLPTSINVTKITSHRHVRSPSISQMSLLPVTLIRCYNVSHYSTSLFWCVSVYACMCVDNTYGGPRLTSEVFLILLHLTHWSMVSKLNPGTHWYRLVNLLCGSCLYLLSTRITTGLPPPRCIYMDSEDLNLDPQYLHVLTPSALSTEPLASMCF